MSRSRIDKSERERFYLLPGQGGAAYRRKQRKILFWSILAGLLIATIFAGGMYLLDRVGSH